MKNPVRFPSIMVIFFLSIMFTSCKKKDVPPPTNGPPPDTETRSLWFETQAERISDDIINMGAQVSENGNLNSFFPGAIVTGAGKTFTIDFGTTGSRGADSCKRTGKLIYDFNASVTNANSFRMPEFSFKVTANNYAVNLSTVTINNKTVTNITPMSVAGQTVYSGTDLVWSDSSDISVFSGFWRHIDGWKSNEIITLLNTNDPACYKGQSFPIDWSKAKIQVNGSSMGSMTILDEFGNTNTEGFTNSVNLLIRDFTCAPNAPTPQDHPFISGSIDFKPGIRAVRHVDYGTGTCDFLQMLTLSGKTNTISL
ncbi:MAG: hypothetical protein JWO32_2161 [Bacteroidetes bacterium]|nr:hypothetical protein [Bacteroidota bacterium]